MRIRSIPVPLSRAVAATVVGLSLLVGGLPSHADSGVSDDRVSLPEGPGSIEGIGENVDVDPNMGLMRHRVVIDVPTGFGAVTPSLSLGYSSGSGSDIVGVGWNMHWPSIERMTRRGVPRYVEEDLFVANGGEELVRVSDSALSESEPAVYRARFEKGFVRYLWHARDGGAGGYWEAQYPDGSVGYFGASADGVAVPEAVEQGDVAGTSGSFKYHLVEKVDVFGHRMRHTYLKDGKRSLLTGVDYVFTDGTPTYQVTLDYGPRADWLSDAKSGFERVLTQRLTDVRVLTRGQVIRHYGLTYEDYDEADNRSRLGRVERFGLGGTRYPVMFTFGYSRPLGAQCTGSDCGEPYLVEMVGDEGLGLSLATGKASLIDINGDALPDLVDTADTNPQHRFFINRLASDGSHTFDTTPVVSALGTPTGFPLDNPRVQLLDINGDGFTDVVNGFSAEALINRGGGDWDSLVQLDTANGYPAVGADVELRFMDYNNDMRIDLVRSDIGSATAYENTGELGFVEQTLGDLGTQFSEGVQFTDMNGDGLLDIAQLLPNQLRYRLNLGWGVFKDWVTLETPYSGSELALASLEDLNGDGYADVAVTSGTQVSYVLNRNGERFDPVQTISEAGGEALPERGPNTLVLAADMNGNGSVDIVWVGENGGVRYLELFPLRPHLLNRIENGVGRVTDITYQPSVEQRALAAEEGRPWANPLPHPMVVVSRVDEWDKLTLVHDTKDYRYFDGFYDGNERQFRGYAQVETLLPEAPSNLEGRIVSRFDVGATEPHRNGLHLETTRFSDGKVVDVTTDTYGDETSCSVDEVPSPTELQASGKRAVRFPCQVANETVLQEGLSSDRWLTTRKEMVYDGYGNVVRDIAHGVVSDGGGSCKPCDQPANTFGEACGAQCLGDEQIVETTFVPLSAADGRWMLRKPSRTRTFGREGDARVAETVTYYDGDDFTGLPEGQLTQGKVTRVSRKVAQGDYLDEKRSAFDQHGNVIATLDPRGTPDGPTNRRNYTYDDDGLRLTSVNIPMLSPQGQRYALERNIRYDSTFDRPVLAHQWIRVVEGEPQAAQDDTAYIYDAFGRLEGLILPGDSGVAPTFSFDYALGNPASAVTTHQRSTSGAAPDMETVKCFDGRGRTYQVRKKTAPGRYLVDGFTIYNLRSEKLRVYQAYESDSATCDETPPEGVRYMAMLYDGVGRATETVHPDGDERDSASIKRMVYEPLSTLTYDPEDNDAASLHHDTPLVRKTDGLGRASVLSRTLASGEKSETVLRYDGLGRLTHLIDAMGHQKLQSYDLVGRLLEVQDPSAGTTTFAHDDVGNVVRVIDGRGVTTEMTYDGLNRLSTKWDPSAPEATLIAFEYDASESCDPALCTNGAGRRVAALYPGGADYKGYDRRRRLITEGRRFGEQTYVVRSEYDAANRLTARIYPDGTRLGRSYDSASRLVSISDVLTNIAYDERGLAVSMTRPNGVVDDVSYDAMMRLSSTTTTAPDDLVLQRISMSRDRVDNIVSVSDTAPDALTTPSEHTYDAWYRLVQGAPGADGERFGYDAIDNLLTRGPTNFAYDAARPGTKSRAGQADLGYDAAGCLTSGGGWTHTWDFMGRLTNSQQNAGTAATNSRYGADHRRVAKTSDGFSTHYVTDDFEVRDGVAVIYPRLGHKRLARIETTASAAAWLGDPVADGVVTAGDAWVAQRDGVPPGTWLASTVRRILAHERSDVVHLHHDQLRSITLATGNDGVVEGRRAFGVYGDTIAQRGYVDQYGFTSQEHDLGTGLVRFEYRFLDPSLGQWISPDPAFVVASPETINTPVQLVARYAYARNNPTTLVDPDGREAAAPNPAATPPSKGSSYGPGMIRLLARGVVRGRFSRGIERFKKHPNAVVISAHNSEASRTLNALDKGTGAPRTYLWALRREKGVYQVAIAPRGADILGHPTLAYLGGNKYASVAAAGELKWQSQANQGAGAWVMNDNSGRLGRTAPRGYLRAFLTHLTGFGQTSKQAARRSAAARNNVDFAAKILQRGGHAEPVFTKFFADN